VWTASSERKEEEEKGNDVKNSEQRPFSPLFRCRAPYEACDEPDEVRKRKEREGRKYSGFPPSTASPPGLPAYPSPSHPSSHTASHRPDATYPAGRCSTASRGQEREKGRGEEEKGGNLKALWQGEVIRLDS
jgi:hypothetical protein